MYKKDPIAESEHNTDCDVTLGITNSYAPIILHIPAHVLGQPPAEPSEVLIKKREPLGTWLASCTVAVASYSTSTTVQYNRRFPSPHKQSKVS